MTVQIRAEANNIMEKRLKESADYILSRTIHRPTTGVMLGSGLGGYAESIENSDVISYKDIPGFPSVNVAGHAGKLVIGKDVCCMSGRFHYYEGFDINEVVLGVRTMRLMGIDRLIVTNAAGGINKSFAPGDLMLIEDHINLLGTNPLIGANIDTLGTRFPDMSEAYSRELLSIAHSCAAELGIAVKSGVYAAVTGPSYETPAEIRAFGTLGADAVGMSTVPEVVAAVHCGMKVLGISCITNMAAGILHVKLNHAEVIETTQRVKNSFIKLLTAVVTNMLP